MYMVYFRLTMALLEYFKKRTSTSTIKELSAVVLLEENGPLSRELPSLSIQGANEALNVAISLARSYYGGACHNLRLCVVTFKTCASL